MGAMHALPIALFAATLSIPFASAQDAARAMDKAKLAEIDTRIEKLVEKGKIAGAVVLVARDGQIMHEGVYGQRDIKTGEAMTRCWKNWPTSL